ncbi:MAG TPA: LytTR family DNA-binding domain-containing protein [Chitinophagaceae bacterium]|nr:LytTR family DNA-binding domain-containing protein [Chitinophagaceae bacterium]
MLRCLAIDDEPLALELLEDNIRQVPFLKLESACSNALEAIRFLQQQSVDLIFLDIQMPGLTGLQFIQSLTQRPMFILVTAYEKYALESYNLDVVDYLVKPVSFERFLKACNKAYDLYNLRNRPAETKPVDYFFVNVDYSLLKVVFNDVLWIEALKDYVKIHLKSTTKPVVTRISMKTLEEQLPESQFIRVHKSYIVSKNSITSIKKNSLFVGAVELPVSDNYKDNLAALISKS